MLISRSNKKIIGITIGDPGGIGPEVILKSFQEGTLERHLSGKDSSNVFFVCIGSVDVLEKTHDLLGSKVKFHVIPSLEEKFLQHDALNILDIIRYVANDFYLFFSLTESLKIAQKNIIVNNGEP